MKRTPNPRLAIETHSQEILRLTRINGGEGVKIDNLNNREEISIMAHLQETPQETTENNSVSIESKKETKKATLSEKPTRWDAQAIEDLKSSMAMLQEAGLSLEDIKRKNPKLFETWKSIEDGKIVAKGTRAETLLHKFMVLNPEHPLSIFVQEHGTNFDFDEEDAIIRINGAKKPKEEESKK